MKIRPVGAEVFYEDIRTDGQADMTKLIVAFRNFADRPKNCNDTIGNQTRVAYRQPPFSITS